MWQDYLCDIINEVDIGKVLIIIIYLKGTKVLCKYFFLNLD